MNSRQLYLALYRQSAFGDLVGLELPQMLADAGREGLNAQQMSAIGYISVAGLLAPMLNDQCLLAGLIAMDPAYVGLPIVGVGNACDSGGLAVLDAAKAVRCGDTHVALAIGAEKMCVKKETAKGPKVDSIRIGQMLGTAGHPDDRFPPFTFPHIFARLMDAYMKKYGYSEEQFAELPPYLYANAAHNPLAHMRTTKSPVTVQAVLESYRLFPAETGRSQEDLPLKLLECSQISDGWARIVVCDEEGLAMLGLDKSQATVLAGWGQAVDGLSLASRGDKLLESQGAMKAFDAAAEMANVTSWDIRTLETHDCFSVMLPLSMEIIGRAEVGGGLHYLLDGATRLDGDIPTNTSGGLIAKGHPISATGVAMIGWIHQQILGQVPEELRVDGCDIGATLNIGGPISSTVATIQSRP